MLLLRTMKRCEPKMIQRMTEIWPMHPSRNVNTLEVANHGNREIHTESKQTLKTTHTIQKIKINK